MEDEKKLYLFEQATVPKAVLSMAIPTVISSLVMVIYNLADTYFVGMLNNSVQNAAVTLAAPVLLAFNAINNLFGVGSSSLMSRALGRKEYDMVRQVSAFGFYCTIFCSFLFSMIYLLGKNPLLILLGTDAQTVAATAEYLKWTVAFGAMPAILNVVMAYMVRSEGSTLHASIGTMSGCFLNILLDPIFILPWGFNMGAAGAGLATFLSNCVACLYFFVLLFLKRNHTYVCVNPTKIRLKKEIAFGFSQGIMPLISYNYAAGNGKRMKQTILFSAKNMLVFLVTISAFYYFGSGFFMRLFMKNETIVAYGSSFLRGLCLALPFLFIDFLAVGVFQAVGMGKKAFLFAILRKIVMEIPAIYLLNLLFPLYGLAYAQMVTEIILAITAVLVLKNMFQKLGSVNK